MCTLHPCSYDITTSKAWVLGNGPGWVLVTELQAIVHFLYLHLEVDAGNWILALPILLTYQDGAEWSQPEVQFLACQDLSCVPSSFDYRQVHIVGTPCILRGFVLITWIAMMGGWCNGSFSSPAFPELIYLSSSQEWGMKVTKIKENTHIVIIGHYPQNSILTWH